MPRINWNELNNVMGKGGAGGQGFRKSKTFWLRKGDQRTIRVRTDDPGKAGKHWVPPIRQYEICSGDEYCVYCKVAADTKGKQCGYARPASVFWVWDYSPYHMESQGEGTTPTFHPCAGSPANCQLCKNGMERRESGLRRMDLWKRETGMLQAADEVLRSRCSSCKVGQLELQAYECKACGTRLEHVDSDYSIVTCPDCGNRAIPAGVYSCDNCEVPIPASILDADITVSKFEDGAVSFQPLGITPLREDIAAVALPPFADEFEAKSPALMSQDLKIQNPFGGAEYKDYKSQNVTPKNIVPTDDSTFS